MHQTNFRLTSLQGPAYLDADTQSQHYSTVCATSITSNSTICRLSSEQDLLSLGAWLPGVLLMWWHTGCSGLAQGVCYQLSWSLLLVFACFIEFPARSADDFL